MKEKEKDAAGRVAYRLTFGGNEDIILLPRKMNGHIVNSSELELKVLLFLASCDGVKVGVEDIAAGLGADAGLSVIAAAVERWRALGLIEADGQAPAQKTPRRRAAKPRCENMDGICAAMESRGEFAALVDSLQEIMGDVFNLAKLSILYNLTAGEGLCCEFIKGIAGFCAHEGKRDLRYMEALALGLKAEGIATPEKLREYIEDKKRYVECEARVRRIFGLGERALTSKEKGCVRRWCMEYGMSDEMLAEGYKRAVAAEKFSFGYINGIIENWRSKGFTSVAQVRDEFKKTEDEGWRRPNGKLNLENIFENALRQG